MTEDILTGTLLDERTQLSLDELARACSISTEWIVELVAEGVLEPIDREPIDREPLEEEQPRWRFAGSSLEIVHTAVRLHDDLQLNLPGVALAMDLLQEIGILRARIARLESDDGA